MTKILTIQDISCVGQCSLTVALPIISAYGVETCILPSAVLSTHTGGFTDFTFRDLTEDFPRVIRHWEKENIRFDGLYTGYIGNPKQMEYILEIKEKLLRNDSPFIVDPAMADFGKLYKGFDLGFVEEMKRPVKEADYILPNITEAEFLIHGEYREEEHTEKYIEHTVKELKKLGAKNVVLKGVQRDGKIGVVTYDGKEIKYFLHEKIDRNLHGTGDVYASCFVGELMRGKRVEEAARNAAELTLAAIKATIDDQTHWYGVKFEQIIPMIAGNV